MVLLFFSLAVVAASAVYIWREQLTGLVERHMRTRTTPESLVGQQLTFASEAQQADVVDAVAELVDPGRNMNTPLREVWGYESASGDTGFIELFCGDEPHVAFHARFTACQVPKGGTVGSLKILEDSPAETTVDSVATLFAWTKVALERGSATVEIPLWAQVRAQATLTRHGESDHPQRELWLSLVPRRLRFWSLGRAR